jgi:hypothetical protein
MSRYAIKFPFRVRIHGGEFDESARAIHREDGLKTIQAESGIVLESTIERKQMSTKTTFKRIALVTVAALGFGVMSVAPSNAGGGIADSVAVSAASSPIALGATASTTLTQAGFLASNADSLTATVSLVTYPAGATATQITSANTITLVAVDTHVANTATTSSGLVQSLIAGSNVTVGGVGGTYGQLLSARTTVSVTPTLAGVYTYKITPGSTTYPSTATALTWTVTVSAKAAATVATVGNTAGSTLVYGPSWNYDSINSMGGTYADPTATSTAELVTAGGVSCYTDLGYGNPCVTGRIVLANGATGGAALVDADAPKLSYVVTGPGLVSLNTSTANWTGALTTQASTVAYETADSWTGTPGSLTKTFLLYTTGVPGTIKLTISSGTTVIATVSAVAFGNAKTITPTVVNNPIVAAATNSGTITAIVKDETGSLVRGATVYAVSNNVASISNSYTSCGASTNAGLVTCNLVALAAGTANITLTTNSAATVTTGVSAAPVAVRVSDGVVTKVDYAFDKASYAPGEAAVIKATVSNAAGIMPAGTYTVLTAGVTGNFTLSGLPTTTVVASLNTGAATYNVTMPTGITGDVKLTGTAATGVTATYGTATVVNAALDAADAATDAALEAIDAGRAAEAAADLAVEAADAATIAAQEAAEAAETAGLVAVAAAEAAGEIASQALEAADAATEAALQAAEAADEATTAATEAKDAADAATAAVAALSAEVTKLMAALTAKVTTLSTLVAKIAKKVKA